MAGKTKTPIRWQAFSLPKRGNSAEEYEDAFAGNPQSGRFAVADGASESSFASLWVRLLVDGFVHPVQQTDPKGGWLGPLQQQWAAQVDGRPLPWYAEAKRQEGAHATLLGLVLRHGPDRAGGGRWQSLAVGDSCLFQIRADKLIKAFPVARADDFGDRPALLGSRPSTTDPMQRQQRDQGRWQPGDRFFLMTDALAHWFLQRCEAGQRPWRAIEAFSRLPVSPDAFAAWVEQLREQDGLHNDDVTLIDIIVTEAPAVGKRNTR